MKYRFISLGMYTYVMWFTRSLYQADSQDFQKGVTWMLKVYV